MSQSTYSASHEQYDYVDPDDFPDGAGFSDDEEDIGEDDFFNSSLLSNVAVKLRDKVPRETHVKGSIPFEGAFTGKDIVSTIQSIIQRDIPDIASDGRRTALAIARSLHAQLFFNEVEWEFRELTDGVEDLYRFMDDMLGASGSGGGNPFLEDGEREELPNGIITPLTRCYVSTCGENDLPCYAWSCPRRVGAHANVPSAFGRAWANGIDPAILATVGRSEINRQTIIHKTILQEAKYLKDLDLIDTLFVKPLRRTQPPIIPLPELDAFIDTVFGNILDLRETNKRILEKLYVRQREQGPFIEYIGDIFLTAATEFRVVYPKYVGNLVRAGQRVQEELDGNARFRAFHDECLTVPEARGLSLPQLITRPSEHLQKYPVLLEAIRNETAEGNHDAEYLIEASEAIKKLSTMAQLRAFQVNMLRGGAAGDKEWHMLVANDVREALPKAEVKRQQAIFELIKSEMAYVRDLEAFQMLFIRPLRAARLPLADPTERGVDDFLRDIFHNYQEILEHQRRLLNAFFEIQSEEYPCVDSIVAPIMDAALNWGDAYMEYTTHYPIAEYRIDEANAMPEFRTVVQEAQRNPEANKLDIKSFINRPVSRILRYVLLLKRILGETPKTHPDQASIPEVVEMLEKLSSALNYAIEAPKKKVQMWKYHHNLVWKPGEEMNLDLLDDTRQLLHTGRLLRQPESGFELGGWSELFVLLFDNYLVMTKAKEKDGVIKYHVNRRPIPLELLTLLSFNEAPIQRSTSLLSNLRGGRSTNAAAAAAYAPMEQGPADHRLVFPCSVYHSARVGGHYLIFAESDQARAEWKDKLEEAINIRKVVLENNKAFEVNTISKDTFVIPMQMATSPQTWNDSAFTGKVTCSIPLRAANGRDLVAVGCAEGVWIGLRNDAASLRRVLHLKNVTQCAMLEDFGIFLVLADKYLFAYHIEALVPTGPAGSAPPREPQRLNKNRDVQFFSVGTLNDRTLIIYMKKKGLDSVFRVLEPVTEKIAEKSKTSNFSRTIFGSQKSEWFREYKEFFLPSEAYDLIFLKVKVAILCAKGFEIMDLLLSRFNSVTIPQRDDPRHAAIAKRSESRRPMGMFRSAENEFLLCYDEFGLYVDRHGDATPRQVGVIEWEGTAERVAFHPPYVVIFDSRFIEIRHIANGKLVQIIQGSDIHCTWDGRGYLSRSNTSIYPNTPGPSGWDENSGAIDARIHAVMKADNGPSVHRNTISQHVFELAPTQLLYAPPPSASHQSQNPTSANYFQTGTAISPRPSSVGTGWSR
ncbi:Dbl-like domain-containing protein [Clavulina sp. PMI_390]|nr:Dbl-like domain-containing protein [Clavulina sp. PMI_390]